MVAFAVCILLLATAPADQIYWKNTFLSMIIAPFAMNWSFPAGTILMSNAVAKKHQGVAASLIATASTILSCFRSNRSLTMLRPSTTQ